ncbi:Phosphatidylinositol 4-kinase type 2 [Aphelenchoides bicaudatus]|nr:Phosphatidylinositol 4-kinase type 2 [Aphelenchoides bicaudatus]
MGTETESGDDETKPLVSSPSPTKSKRPVMATISNASNQSGSDLDEHGAIEQSCLYMNDEYKQMLLKALRCIDVFPPSLISSGSSGSYFIHGDQNEILGIFKPADEEPYGINNPKWGKWFQKVFLPCTFGRGCLVPNQGYVSEAIAYVVDQHLQLNVVPATAVVGFASKVFNYSRIQRYEARAKQRIASRFPDLQNRFNWSKAYKKKKGSFQTFVPGYMDPDEFLQLYPIDTLTEGEKKALTIEFQKMFTLDFIIRNTDRLNANYLIKVTDSAAKNLIVPESKQEAKEVIIDIMSEPSSSSAHSPVLIKTESGENFVVQQAQTSTEPMPHSETIPESHTIGPSSDFAQQASSTNSNQQDRIFTIACIDNGLAFPFKHPSDVRSYPFSWAKYFPYFANQPFAPEIKDLVLPILQNLHSVNLLCEKVKIQLNLDKRFQKQKTIKTQLAVFRGQMYNLLKALENNLTPAHLETKTPYYAKLKKKKKRRSRNRRNNTNGDAVHIEVDSDDESADSTSATQSPAVELWRANYSIKKHTKNPYFCMLLTDNQLHHLFLFMINKLLFT